MKHWNEFTIDSDVKLHKKVPKSEYEKELADIITLEIKYRKIMGITQEELAAMSHLSLSSIIRLESFKATPNLLTLIKVFNALGLELHLRESSKKSFPPSNSHN